MALELIVNLILLFGCIGFFVNVSTTMPHSAVNELGAEQWPQAILILLILAIGYNLFKYFRNNRREDIAAAFRDFIPSVGRLLKSKLFTGMVLVVVMALMYEPVGFIVTCLLFLIAYGLLLGQRNIPVLLLSSVLITVILYIGFSVMLGVMLPRGQFLPLRNFALFIESLVPRF
ncbi:tripartite tricarboxylate transporter TctB family protein [uncultured Oscillibacter sp.]|uniref:tripartite tricarboxylate transporter TctB family protein n=1 Tax=uncultured Oscillibacter sp. TaxID=876091 RepID=UPI00260FE55C|nr:tripartite tricarboxylate transporter TctB family protein [uncultured Oscillibacter sp.]